MALSPSRTRMRYDISNWYWIVAASTTQVYSSKRAAYVLVTDVTYIAWLAAGNRATRIVSEVSLNDVLNGQSIAGLTAVPALIAYSAAARYAKETGGITVNGVAMPTDRQTQAQLTGAYSFAQSNSAVTIQWKMPDGSFMALTAAQISAIAVAVAMHVQTCFAVEQQLDASINATPPTITTSAQVDTTFAAVSV